MPRRRKKSEWFTLKVKKKNVPSSPLSESETVPDPDACSFCRSKVDNENLYGKLLKKDGVVTHYFCLLFASGLAQNGKTESDGLFGFLPRDIKRELSRGHRFRCVYCRKIGATIGCCNKSCRAVFHFTCGRENDSLNQFFGNFNSFCGVHRLKQTVPSSDRLSFHGTAITTCAICMCSVEARASNETLRTPCCKNSWYHRDCIQNQALSAGLHFFKCPLCNNSNNFQKEMLTFGIYIPDQDASWEREANAFQDLLDRHSRCDVEKCLSNEGRMFKDSGRFNIALCDSCGAQGTHLICSNLRSIESDWMCVECTSIHKQVKGKKKATSVPKSASTSKLKKKKKKESVDSYLEEKRQSSYKPTTAFPVKAKKGKKRKCSAAEGLPPAKHCRIMECSVKLTSIDKQMESESIFGEEVTVSPGKTSVKFHSKGQISGKLAEEMQRSKLDLSRFKAKLEAIRHERSKLENVNASLASNVITSPITGQQIEVDTFRKKLDSLNKYSGSFSNDSSELSDFMKSPKSGSSSKSIQFFTHPFPRKSSILSTMDTCGQMKSSSNTPKSSFTFGDNTPSNSSVGFGYYSPSSSFSDFSPKSFGSYTKQKTPLSSCGSPLFVPVKSSIYLQQKTSKTTPPSLLSSSKGSIRSKFQAASASSAFSTPRMGCRSPQVEVSSAGTHVVHSECSSERINRNIVRSRGTKTWSACSLHSKHCRMSHHEPRQSAKRLDFLDTVERKYGQNRKTSSASLGSPMDNNVTMEGGDSKAAGLPFRLYPSQVPLSKPEFDKLWSSSSSGSESESTSHKRTPNKHTTKKWYYLPKGETRVAKHAFNPSGHSGLRSSSTHKPNLAHSLRRRDHKTSEPGKMNSDSGQPIPGTSWASASASPSQPCTARVPATDQCGLFREQRSFSPSSNSDDDQLQMQDLSDEEETLRLVVDTSTEWASPRSDDSRAMGKSAEPGSIGLDPWSDFTDPRSAPHPAVVLSDSDDDVPNQAATVDDLSQAKHSCTRPPSPSMHQCPADSDLQISPLPSAATLSQSDVVSVSKDKKDSTTGSMTASETSGDESVIVVAKPNTTRHFVDLTEEEVDEDDDDDCVVVRSVAPKHRRRPEFLAPGMLLFRGPGNKVLVPLSQLSCSQRP